MSSSSGENNGWVEGQEQEREQGKDDAEEGGAHNRQGRWSDSVMTSVQCQATPQLTPGIGRGRVGAREGWGGGSVSSRSRSSSRRPTARGRRTGIGRPPPGRPPGSFVKTTPPPPPSWRRESGGGGACGRGGTGTRTRRRIDSICPPPPPPSPVDHSSPASRTPTDGTGSEGTDDHPYSRPGGRQRSSSSGRRRPREAAAAGN